MKYQNYTKAELIERLNLLENELNSFQIKDSAGIQSSVNEKSEDISTGSSKEYENDILQQQELYKKLISAYPDAIVHADILGNLTYISSKSIKLFGYESEGDLLGRNLFEFVAQDLRKNAVNNFRQAYAGKKFTNSLYKLQRKDGTIFWGEINSAIVQDFEGNPRSIIITIRDVSERVNFEKIKNALYRISEAVNTTGDLHNLYRSIHEIVRELMPADNFYIALFDPVLNILSFPYFVDKYDQMPEPRGLKKGLTEYVLKSGRDLLVDEKADLALRESGEIEMLGEPTKIWLGVALKLFGRTIGVMVVQDYENENAYGEQEKQLLIFVSEQIATAIDKKRQEEELFRFTEELQISRDMLEERASEFARLNELLADSERELQELNASKDKFFSILAHDLRSPFNGLLGFSNILVEDLDSLSKEEIKNFAIQIQGSAKNLFNLIENLLQWSRIQSGKLQCQPIRLDINDVVNDVISVLTGNAIRKNITLRNEMKPFSYAYADQNMIYSTIQNLVANAIKFTGNGGEVKILSEEINDSLKVTVADTGIGIKSSDMDKLFRIDVQHSTMGTAKEKGTGLGLILCKELIEKQGGTINVESEEGKGTSFSFTLPLSKKIELADQVY
ncbi:MAG: ATP-binding protein [Bacillota bacterium]